MPSRNVVSIGLSVAALLLSAILAAGGEDGSLAAAAGAAASPPSVGELVRARDARLSAGDRDVTLLALARVGRLVVSCDAATGPSVAFRADHLLATADVVVDRAGDAPTATTIQPGDRYQPAPAAGVLLQTWHIAPFTEAQARVTVISVAARRLPTSQGHACSASARATISRSRWGTLTR